jgi:hypothetical protein
MTTKQCACGRGILSTGRCPSRCEDFRRPHRKQEQLEKKLREREKRAGSRVALPSHREVSDGALRARRRRPSRERDLL